MTKVWPPLFYYPQRQSHVIICDAVVIIIEMKAYFYISQAQEKFF